MFKMRGNRMGINRLIHLYKGLSNKSIRGRDENKN